MLQPPSHKTISSTFRTRKPWALPVAALALLVSPAFLQNAARASDHGETAENVARSGADLTDVFIFPSASSEDNVVLVMNVQPLIPKRLSKLFSFDPEVLYQFKIDTSGDSVEDRVIQVRFKGTGASQEIFIAGPEDPRNTSVISTLLPNFASAGRINNRSGGEPKNFKPGNFRESQSSESQSSESRSYKSVPMRVFAGAREDPFFFDFERFALGLATQEMFPDRRTPLEPPQPRTFDKTIKDPNKPLTTSWRPPGKARDFFKPFNVLSIVVELPRAALGGGIIRLWATTSPSDGNRSFIQQERLARPLINETLATVSNERHRTNNRITPAYDRFELARDMESFLTYPAGRSRATKDAIKSLLVPDVMIADLSKPGPASYLGVESKGANGGSFGGRALTDDVVDALLGIIFGTTISDMGLAPADGKETPSLTSDNVGADKHFLSEFPYLGDPR